MNETTEDFIRYLKDHPTERLYQALRNWSGADFIMYWKKEKYDISKAEKLGLKDTFYFIGKDR